MPPKKQNRTPVNPLASVEWLVYDRYELDADGNIHAAGYSHAIGLDQEQLQDEMLDAFVTISTEQEALQFIDRYGPLLPDLHSEARINDDLTPEIVKPMLRIVVEAAASMAWLRMITNAISGEDQDLPMVARWIKEIPAATFTNPIFALQAHMRRGNNLFTERSNQHGGMWNFQKAVFDKVDKEQPLDDIEQHFLKCYETERQLIEASTYLTLEPTTDERQEGPLQNFVGIYGSAGIAFSRTIHLSSIANAPLGYPRGQYKAWAKNGPRYAAQNYLRQTLNEMLADIKPSLEWIPPADMGEWSLGFRLRVECPWDAMVYAMSRRITRQPGLTPCKRCGKLFSAKRADARGCSPACREWLRLNAPIRNYNKN